MNRFYTVNPNGIRSTIDEFQVKEELPKSFDISGFDDFLIEAEAIQEASADYRLLGMEIKPFVDQDGMIRVQLGNDGDIYNLTDWSLSQLSQRLGVPAGYATKMADAGKRDLFVANFKSWIDSHHAGKYFLARTHGDTIRGFLSDAYHATDSNIVLPIMQESLQTTNMNFNVHKGIINPEYTNVRVISDRQIDIGGDPHFMGMGMSTSDVGRATMKMEFFVYRSACTNGMLFGKHGGTIFKKKHTTRHMTDQENFESEVREGLKDIDKLVVYAEDLLKESSVYKLQQGEMDRIIGEYRNFAGIGAREAETVTETIKNFMPGYDRVDQTLWSASNAFTEMAQNYSLDRAEKMESFAGHLLHQRLHA